MKTFAVSIAALFIWTACGDGNQPIIDREALVERNSPVVTAFDSLASLSVGNGEFAYTVDITGLQTFPDNYKKGVPLGTQSQWGWHSFANPGRLTSEETLKEYDFGRGKNFTLLNSKKKADNKMPLIGFVSIRIVFI